MKNCQWENYRWKISRKNYRWKISSEKITSKIYRWKITSKKLQVKSYQWQVNHNWKITINDDVDDKILVKLLNLKKKDVRQITGTHTDGSDMNDDFIKLPSLHNNRNQILVIWINNEVIVHCFRSFYNKTAIESDVHKRKYWTLLRWSMVVMKHPQLLHIVHFK